MPYINKGNIDVKGQVLTEPMFGYTQSKGVSKLTFNFESLDNIHYNCIVFGELAERINGKVHDESVVHIKGKYQINEWEGQEKDEIIVNHIQPWPKDGSDINELLAIMKRTIDTYCKRMEKGDEILKQNPKNETRVKLVGMNDFVERLIICVNLLQHDCRPLIGDYKYGNPVIILLYDGNDNVYKPILPKSKKKEEIPEDLPFE